MTIADELLEGKLSIVSDRPNCIHSLGTIRKKDGGCRIITDCTKPEVGAVNLYMEDVFRHFSYTTYVDIIPE